uniref:Uncharacterized protein n=1 Tax=Lepeophtheirus salmonis TaxID=72036 RepID=A0A0K2VJ11_LEPSM
MNCILLASLARSVPGLCEPITICITDRLYLCNPTMRSMQHELKHYIYQSIHVGYTVLSLDLSRLQDEIPKTRTQRSLSFCRARKKEYLDEFGLEIALICNIQTQMFFNVYVGKSIFDKFRCVRRVKTIHGNGLTWIENILECFIIHFNLKLVTK